MTRILIIEDDKDINKIMSGLLTKNGYEVERAFNGKEAEPKIKTIPDLILMDLMLPDTTGEELLKLVPSGTPVIAVSARSTVDDKVDLLSLGCVDYITKPFDNKELLARIRVLTRQPAVASDNLLRFGNLSLDRGTFELSSPKGKYRLAGKEFQMMEMLMMNPGILISSEKFMEKIWGLDSEADISTAWTYISYLRKKLTALDANVQIRAVRNSGYTLEEIK